LRERKEVVTFAPASRNMFIMLLDTRNKKNTFLDILNWQPF